MIITLLLSVLILPSYDLILSKNCRIAHNDAKCEDIVILHHLFRS
jgi:hypothetical protein